MSSKGPLQTSIPVSRRSLQISDPSIPMYLKSVLQERALLSHVSWVRDKDEKGQRTEKDTHQNE